MYKVNYSNYIIGADTEIVTSKGIKKRIYFNNGATTLMFNSVVQKLKWLYPQYTYTDLPNWNSNEITIMYNKSREIIKKYIGADKDKDTVIYVKNATEGINFFSNTILEEDPNQIVLTTKMEHLANYLPYKEKLKTELIGLTKDGNIDLVDYKRKLERYKGKVKYVCVTGATNVTGIIPPFYEMARLAHQYGAKIFVDIVQLLQHKMFDMKPHNDPEHIDFVAFSAHKCYTGLDSGGLIGPKEVFDKYNPLQYGAGTTKFVDSEKIIYDNAPLKYEPGYPDVLGVIAMGTALETLEEIGLYNISNIEKELNSYLLKGLRSIPNIKIYGYDNIADHIPFVAFNVKNMSPSIIADKLGYEYGIEITSGTVGANIYVQNLLNLTNEEAYKLYLEGVGYGLVRVSLGFYNTFEEIDVFIDALRTIVMDNDNFC